MPATTSAAGGSPPTPVPACVTWVAVLIVALVGKVSEWVPGLSSIPLAKIAFLCAAIAAFRGRAELPAVRIRSLRIARPAIAFMTLALISVTFSIYKSNTLIASEFVLILVLSMILLLRVTQTLRDVERLLLGFAAASASLALGLVLNYHGGRASINENFDPNEIAYALDSALPIVLALRPRESRLHRLLLNALALVIVVSILLTGSRGGAIGLCVVTVGLIAFPLSSDRDGTLRRFSLGRSVVKCAALVLTAALAWGYLPTATQERMATLLDLPHDYSADPTLKGSRAVIWRRDMEMALQRPIGYGLGSEEAVDGLYGGQYRAAHNSLVQAFVELGVLGLLLFLYSYFTSWRYLGRVGRADGRSSPGDRTEKAPLYARALRMGLAGNLAAGFFLSQAYSPALWLMVALAAALVRITLPAPGAVATAAPAAASAPTTIVGVRN